MSSPGPARRSAQRQPRSPSPIGFGAHVGADPLLRYGRHIRPLAPPISFKGYALTYIALRAPIVVEMMVLAIGAFVLAPLTDATAGSYLQPPTLGPRAMSAVAMAVATLTAAYVGASAWLAWRGRLFGLFMGCFDLSLLFYGLGYLAMAAGRHGWPKPFAAEAFDSFWFVILLAPQPVVLGLALWSIKRLVNSLERGWE